MREIFSHSFLRNTELLIPFRNESGRRTPVIQRSRALAGLVRGKGGGKQLSLGRRSRSARLLPARGQPHEAFDFDVTLVAEGHLPSRLEGGIRDIEMAWLHRGKRIPFI